MIGLLIIGALLAGVALAISGNLARIADALEAQNRYYGIPKKDDEPDAAEPAGTP